MKSLYFLILVLILVSINPAHSTINEIEEFKSENKLTFRAKKSTLWLRTHSTSNEKSKGDSIEVSLGGELYNPPKKILDIKKKDVDRSTLVPSFSSYSM